MQTTYMRKIRSMGWQTTRVGWRSQWYWVSSTSLQSGVRALVCASVCPCSQWTGEARERNGISGATKSEREVTARSAKPTELADMPMVAAAEDVALGVGESTGA